MSTLVVFANADDQNISSSDATYATARSGSTIALGSTSATGVNAAQSWTSGTGKFACVLTCLHFDTSGLSGTTPASATLRLTSTGSYAGSDVTTLEARVHTWSAPLTSADFVPGATYAAKALCASLGSASWPGASTGVDLTSDANILTSINPSGTTGFILGLAEFAAGTPPSSAVTNADQYNFSSTDTAGTASDPKLTIIYGAFVRSEGPLGSAVSANLDVAYPATISSGHRFLVAITAQDNIASTLTGWTLKQGTNNGSGLRTEIWEKDATAAGTETGSVTFTRSSGLASEGRMLAIAGADSATNFIEAIAASANSSSSTVTLPSLTSLTNGALIVAVQSIVGVGTFGLPSGTDPTFVEASDDSFDPRPQYLGATPVNSSSAGTGFTLAIPTNLGIAVGDLVILSVTTKSATTTSVTRSSGGGATNPWSSLRAAQLNLAASATATTLYYGHIIESADIGASVVFAYNGGSVKHATVATYWHNAAVLASQPNTSAAQANASASTATLPTVTPGVANTVELAVAGSGATVNISSITGFTVPAGAAATGSGGSGTTQCGTAIAYKTYPASGGATGTSTVNLSGASSGCATAHIVIAPASATSNPVSMAISDDNKTTAGAITGLTATASITAVNTGVLLAIKPTVVAAATSFPPFSGSFARTPRFLSPRRRLI